MLLLDHLSILIVSRQDFLSVIRSSDTYWLNAEVVLQNTFSGTLGEKDSYSILFSLYTNMHPSTQMHTYLLQQLSHWVVICLFTCLSPQPDRVLLEHPLIIFELLYVFNAKYRLWHRGAQTVESMNEWILNTDMKDIMPSGGLSSSWGDKAWNLQ